MSPRFRDHEVDSVIKTRIQRSGSGLSQQNQGSVMWSWAHGPMSVPKTQLGPSGQNQGLMIRDDTHCSELNFSGKDEDIMIKTRDQ